MSGFISSLLRIKLSANSLSCTECAIVVAEIQQIKLQKSDMCSVYVRGIFVMAWAKFTLIKSQTIIRGLLLGQRDLWFFKDLEFGQNF